MLAGDAASRLSSAPVVGEPVTVWQAATAAPAIRARTIRARRTPTKAPRIAQGLRCVVVTIESTDLEFRRGRRDPGCSPNECGEGSTIGWTGPQKNHSAGRRVEGPRYICLRERN